jgi:hypothetical protein
MNALLTMYHISAARNCSRNHRDEIALGRSSGEIQWFRGLYLMMAGAGSYKIKCDVATI